VNVEVVPPSAAPPGAEPEALIKEARRRQRRRQLLGCAVAVILVGGALGVVVGRRGTSMPPTAMPPAHHPPPSSGPGYAARLPAPIPASVDSTVLMWPVGPEQDGTIYLDNLRTGHLGWATPVVDPGAYQPIMQVSGKIIYVVTRGVLATDAATGRTRVLGHTLYFAPSGRPGHIWLVYEALARREIVRLAPVGAGQGPSWLQVRTPACCWRRVTRLNYGIPAALGLLCRTRRLLKASPSAPSWSPMTLAARTRRPPRI